MTGPNPALAPSREIGAETVIPLFNRVYPDIKINHVQVDVDTKLPPTLAAGVDVPDGSFYEDINIVQVQEDLHDLSPWIDEYLDNIVPFKRSVYTFDNRVVAVPWDFDPMVLWYREDVFDKADVDPAGLTTFTALTNAASTIKEKVPSASAPIFFDGLAANIQGMVAGFGNQLHTPMVTASGQPNLNNPQFLQVLTWMKDITDKKLATIAQGGTTDEFAAVNQGSEVIIPSGTYYDYLFQFQATTTAGKWRATLLPAWTKGGARSGVDGGSGFIVPSKGKQPYLAFLWFAFLNFNKVGYTAQFGPNKIYPQGLNTVLPSYLPALDASKPLFKPFKAVGDQNLWALFTEAAKQVPGGFRLPTWYNQAANYFGSNVELLMAGKMEPQQVLRSQRARSSRT